MAWVASAPRESTDIFYSRILDCQRFIFHIEQKKQRKQKRSCRVDNHTGHKDPEPWGRRSCSTCWSYHVGRYHPWPGYATSNQGQTHSYLRINYNGDMTGHKELVFGRRRPHLWRLIFDALSHASPNWASVKFKRQQARRNLGLVLVSSLVGNKVSGAHAWQIRIGGYQRPLAPTFPH